MRFTKTDFVKIFILFVVTVFILSAIFENAFKTEEENRSLLFKTQNSVMSLVSKVEKFTKNYTFIQQNHKNTEQGSNDKTFHQAVQTMNTPLPPIVEQGFPIINRRVAEEINQKVRVLCWIPSREIFRETRLKATNSTWAKRCDKVIYIISSPKVVTSDTLPVDIPDSRGTLNDKTIFAHRHFYKHYLDKFDWFLKADDDTYVIMENLKFLLSKFDLSTPGYVGCQLKHYSPQGYMNGGAGYAFNALGIKTIVEQGYNIPGRCRLRAGAEDIENGYCANKAGVKTFNQLDIDGKQTFVSSSVYENVVGPLPSWTRSNVVANVVLGLNCCSPLVVSFHHADEKLMMAMEYLLYRVVVHGRHEIKEEAERMFNGKDAKEIGRDVPRRAYPGEVIGDYDKDKQEEWRKSNVTAHDAAKRKNIAIQRLARERVRRARKVRNS